jgi:hypothetical protein
MKDLNRQWTEQTLRRDECATSGNELAVRTRKAILGFFGPDSTQYAQCGGTRSSQRKTPTRKSRVVPLDQAA